MATAGVDRALCICTTLEEFDAVHALAANFDNFWATVGVHPDNEGVTEPTVQDLVDRAGRQRVVAIGETGLDYYQMEQRKGGRAQCRKINRIETGGARGHRGEGGRQQFFKKPSGARVFELPISARKINTVPTTISASEPQTVSTA